MAPKAAAADEKDPAAAAATALTDAIESLQSDDPAVRSNALQSLATLCTSPLGESDVHDRLGVIMPTLLRLLDQDASALHFASTLAQLPWGTEALIRHGGLPPLLCQAAAAAAPSTLQISTPSPRHLFITRIASPA